MNTNTLPDLLKAITVQALGELAGANDDLGNLAKCIKKAVCIRKIVGNVQFDDFVDLIDDVGDASDIAMKFKLAPSLLELAYDNDLEVYTLCWALILPNLKKLPDHRKPRNAIDVLEMASIEIDDIDDEDSKFESLRRLIALISR